MPDEGRVSCLLLQAAAVASTLCRWGPSCSLCLHSNSQPSNPEPGPAPGSCHCLGGGSAGNSDLLPRLRITAQELVLQTCVCTCVYGCARVCMCVHMCATCLHFVCPTFSGQGPSSGACIPALRKSLGLLSQCSQAPTCPLLRVTLEWPLPASDFLLAPSTPPRPCLPGGRSLFPSMSAWLVPLTRSHSCQVQQSLLEPAVSGGVLPSDSLAPEAPGDSCRPRFLPAGCSRGPAPNAALSLERPSCPSTHLGVRAAPSELLSPSLPLRPPASPHPPGSSSSI